MKSPMIKRIVHFFYSISLKTMCLVFIFFLSPLHSSAFPISGFGIDTLPKTNMHVTNVFVQQQVTGTVLDENGMPLPGASVVEKGTTNGTQTDFDGNFSIMATTPNAILSISYIGFLTSEIPINGKSTINVQLEIDAQNLDEVVVVGYGGVKRRDLTGSIGSIKGEELAIAPVATFDNALAGRISGVQVTSSQGKPGAPTNIVIRGSGSLTQSNAPLYVIDGFPIEDFDTSSLDQSDIESMEILKGPSAVAIYGARGGNGVILITTKSGKEGKAQITYSEYYGIENISNRIDVLSPYDFVDLRFEVDSLSAVETYGSLGRYRNIKGLNWQDEVFRQTNVKSHTLSASGGSETTKYNVSLSRYEGKGLLENSGFTRTYAKVKLEQKLTNKLKIGTNVSYTSSVVDGTNTSTNILDPSVQGGSSSARFNLLKDIVQGRPTGGLGISNEELLLLPEDPETEEGAPITNPIVNAETQFRKDIRNTLLFNGYFDYSIMDGLQFKVSGGIQKQNRRLESFDEINSAFERRNGYTRGFIRTIEQTNTLVSSTLTYKKLFGEDHDFTGLLGFDYQDIVRNSVTASSSAFPEPNLGINDLGAGTQPGFPESSKSPTDRLISFFGRAIYSFKDRYIVTGTLRRDGSSKFGANEKFGIFPSFSAAWRFSDESFINNSGLFSNGKLRLEWGQVGNNRIPAFVSSAVLTTVTYGLDNGTAPGVRPANLANPDIKWEAQEQIDIGLDVGFFRNRLSLIADAYRKTSNDLLLEAPLPTSTGFTNVFRNIGKIRNEGLEVAINSVNIDKKLRWSTNLNLTFPKTKTLALVENDTLLSNSSWNRNNPSTDPYSQDFITMVGKPFGLMYGYLDDGLYRKGDFDENGNPFITVAFGDEELGYRKYVDVNKDGVIDENDKVVLGNPNPKFFGGLNNSFSFKGFDLSIFLQWSYGNDIYNANRALWTSDLKSHRNFIPEVINRWRDSNTEEQNNAATFRSINDATELLTDQYIEDGSFLRLKTISLGYSLPREVLEKIRFQNMRLYVTGQNLMTWTNYTGYDPEVSTRGNGLTSGVDFGAYPRSKTYILGLSVSF